MPSLFPYLLFCSREHEMITVHLADIDKLILKFIWKGNKTRTAKIILKKSDKFGGITPLDFKTYNKTSVEGVKDGAWLNGTEQRTQKWTHTRTDN